MDQNLDWRYCKRGKLHMGKVSQMASYLIMTEKFFDSNNVVTVIYHKIKFTGIKVL